MRSVSRASPRNNSRLNVPRGRSATIISSASAGRENEGSSGSQEGGEGRQPVAQAGGGGLARAALDGAPDHVLAPEVGVDEDVALVVDDGAVAGGGGLHDPPPRLHRPQAGG